MATLRARFSGMSLFEEKHDGSWLVRLLYSDHHVPGIWFDPTTCDVDPDETEVSRETHCVLEREANGTLCPRRKELLVSQRLGGAEKIKFMAASGPVYGRPGAISFQLVHPGLTGVNEGNTPADKVAARIELNGGYMVPGPEREVIWNQVPGGTTPPRMVPLWTDYLLVGDSPFLLRSTREDGSFARSWKVTAIQSQVDLWVVNPPETVTPGDPSGKHFTYHFRLLEGSYCEPYPNLRVGLPYCPEDEFKAANASSFCPDGQFP